MLPRQDSESLKKEIEQLRNTINFLNSINEGKDKVINKQKLEIRKLKLQLNKDL